MRKLKRRYARWKEWRKFCHFNKFKQWLIFLGLIRCTWFEQFDI